MFNTFCGRKLAEIRTKAVKYVTFCWTTTNIIRVSYIMSNTFIICAILVSQSGNNTILIRRFFGTNKTMLEEKESPAKYFQLASLASHENIAVFQQQQQQAISMTVQCCKTFCKLKLKQ